MKRRKNLIIGGINDQNKVELGKAYKNGLENATLYKELKNLTVTTYVLCSGEKQIRAKKRLKSSLKKAKDIYKKIHSKEKKYFDVKIKDNILNLNYKAFIDVYRTIEEFINKSQLEKKAATSA